MFNRVLSQVEVALKFDSFICVHGMNILREVVFYGFRRKRLAIHVSDGVIYAKELDLIVADKFTES